MIFKGFGFKLLENPSQIQVLGSQSNATAKLNYRSAPTPVKQVLPQNNSIISKENIAVLGDA